MNLTIEITLWTSALIIAVLSLIYSYIAARKSTKANRAVQELLMDSLIAEEAEKFLNRIMKERVTYKLSS